MDYLPHLFDQVKAKLDATASLMVDFPSINTVNEVGMLICAMDTSSPRYILNGPTPVAQCPYFVRRARGS